MGTKKEVKETVEALPLSKTDTKRYRVFGPRMETVAQVCNEAEAQEIAAQFKGSYKILD